MSNYPPDSLGRVLDDLGGTFLELVHGSVTAASHIGGVHIYDPYDDVDVPPRHIVLGAGVQGAAQLAEFLANADTIDAAAVVVRAPVVIDDAVRELADRAGIPILRLNPAVSWAYLAGIFGVIVGDGAHHYGGAHTLAGLPSGDLFAVANAVSTLLDASVTIEDHDLRVLAFSAQQDNVDSARTATVLDRQTPPDLVQYLEQSGVLPQLRRSRSAVFVEAATAETPAITVDRSAICIRAGDEVLGYMWAASTGRFTTEHEQVFVDSAELVALHILHHRAGADVDRRLRADLVAAVLDGGKSANEAARRLGIRRTPGVVLALGLKDDQVDLRTSYVTAKLDRLHRTFAQHLAAMYPGSAVALLGGTVYGLLPAISTPEDLERRAVQVAAAFVGSQHPFHALVGIGRVTDDARGLPKSRMDADRALGVLRADRAEQRIASFPDVYTEALLLDLRELLVDRGDAPAGPVARLMDYDERHGTDMVETLAAWLNNFGRISAAAQSLHVHDNTFRYRLRRLKEIGLFDLDDPNARFAAMLDMRLLRDRDDWT